jgi:hypothetical protein
MADTELIATLWRTTDLHIPLIEKVDDSGLLTSERAGEHSNGSFMEDRVINVCRIIMEAVHKDKIENIFHIREKRQYAWSCFTCTSLS